MKRIAGVDPSLSSTGLAIITQTEGAAHIPGRTFLTVGSLKPDGGTPKTAVQEVERVQSIVDAVCVSTHGALSVLVEGLALNSRTGKYAERAHLFYALLGAMHARRQPVDQLAPTSLKKQVTGNGRADKEQVLAAVRAAWGERGWSDGTKQGRYDRADAAGLAWVSAAQAGWDVPPLP